MTKREEIELLKQRLEVALKRIEALEREIAKVGKPTIVPPAPFDFEGLRKDMEKAQRMQRIVGSPGMCGVAQNGTA